MQSLNTKRAAKCVRKTCDYFGCDDVKWMISSMSGHDSEQ